MKSGYDKKISNLHFTIEKKLEKIHDYHKKFMGL